jgi:DNA-directed RNA polymerase subunit M
MFCQKCKSLLLPKNDGRKKKMVCTSCGYEEVIKDGTAMTFNEKLKEKKKIEVVEKKDEGSLPVTEISCEKCDNNKAYFWLLQTRSSDEPETKFYKCTKCKHIWREYL